MKKWQARIMRCKSCQLSKTRMNVVLGRGPVPADVLFMGEAPGKSEDVLAEAFVGRSGKLLNKMIIEARKLKDLKKHQVKYFITNTILCRPTDEFGGKNREPKPNEVACCGKNITKIIEKVNPKIVIFVGKISQKYYGDEFKEGFAIQHPAFLLRTGGEKSPWYKQNIRMLEEAFNALKKEAVNEDY